jgi:hypothetical protein
VLRDNFGLVASNGSIQNWIRDQRIEPTDSARRELAAFDARRKAGWQSQIDARRDNLLGALDAACEKRNYLGMQQAATATGILYDKLVPAAKAGVTVNAGGEGATVQLLVVAPSSEKPDRPVIEG